MIIGLVAAAISTADSQIFALGGETRSLLKGEDKSMIKIARIGIFIFALLSLIFALKTSDQLVLLARSSFMGTALMAPMIFTGIFYNRANQLITIPWLTLGAILLFILSEAEVVPKMVGGVRTDLILLGVLGLYALVATQLDRKKAS